MLQCAANMAETASFPCVFFLYGELGAGKTTFVRGFLQALGIVGRVKSPTYTLVESYSLPDGREVFHFDLYRLISPDEVQQIGIAEYFHANAICFIEWPEKAAPYLPAPDIDCYFEYADDGRLLRFVPRSKRCFYG